MKIVVRGIHYRIDPYRSFIFSAISGTSLIFTSFMILTLAYPSIEIPIEILFIIGSMSLVFGNMIALMVAFFSLLTIPPDLVKSMLGKHPVIGTIAMRRIDGRRIPKLTPPSDDSSQE